MEENRDKIGEDFASFIRGFRGEEGQLTYLDQLRDLPIRGGHSLVVDFQHLVQYEGALASELEQNPREMFKLFSESGLLMLTELDMEFARKVQRFNVRVSNYQRKVSIRSLNSSYIGKMVSITGVVVRSSEVMTQLKTGAFRCMSCQTVTPADQVGSLYTTPRACPVCNRSGLGTFELEPSLSTFEDFQSISLQERPEDLPAGHMPQTLDLALTDDLVSSARPGDRVVVTGMVNVKQRAAGFGRSKSRVFELSLDTNHIAVETGEQLEAELDEESIRSFRADASQPWHYKKLISSIAPSIHGMENVKEAVLLQLAGGNPKEFRDGIKVRGDVNVLLVGDPGCYSGDTRLVLGDGSMPTFRELAGMLGVEAPGIYPVSLKVKNRTEEQATALHIYEGQPVIEITLASGRSIRATPNNPFFTSKGWRRADQLKVGTSIRMRRRIHSDIKDYHPTAWKLVSRDHSRNHVVSVPEVVDERLAALTGILTAEGYVDGPYSIALAVNQHEKQLAASTAQTIKDLFGYEPSESVLKRNGKNGRTLDLIRLRVTNPHIVKWLNPVVKEKRVPSSIFMSPDSVVASYVRWLFEGDGNVRSQAKMRDRYVALSSKSMELLRDIQLLLLRFGVESHIYAKSNKKECFVLRIRDARSLRLFARYIGFVSERKRGQLNDLLQGYSNGRRLPERSVMDHILKIERRAPETVYDLEVPKTNSLIVNGIIGHNTAKSQLLKYIQKIAPRGLYTSGRGATAAGLTAAAIRDETGAFSLEAGALVLADKGLAAIDEFEKMREEDRVAIHEAMEQQTCSIAKGGIVATLNARTSILAAANPQFGRYDLNRNFAENVNLSPVILSRFDLYFVLRDVPDETRDALLTAHIIAQHRKMERAAEATYDTMYLKRYVAYAKVSAPKLSDEAAQAISRFFLDLRKSGGESSIHITPRQLESLIRESEARAKLMLRDIVTKEDVEVVIALFRSSLSQAGLDVETGKTDIDILMTGKARSSWEKHNVIVKIAEDLEKEFGSANIEEVLKRAEGKGVDRADGRRIINDLLRNGYFYTPDDVSLKKTR